MSFLKTLSALLEKKIQAILSITINQKQAYRK